MREPLSGPNLLHIATEIVAVLAENGLEISDGTGLSITVEQYGDGVFEPYPQVRVVGDFRYSDLSVEGGGLVNLEFIVAG